MLIFAALLAVPLDTKPARACATVNATYAIYANNDFLRIDRSRHLVEVVSDALDKELDERGWHNVAARGRFTLCSQRMTNPLNWNVRDRVDLVTYRNIHFVARPGR